ncbi:hypothetical protein ACFLYT_01775, partial [Nanoarchaeota archaeon]
YRAREDITAFLLYPKQFQPTKENKEIIKNLVLNDNLVLSKNIHPYHYLLFVNSDRSKRCC